jgi:AcrR family transcriptional regulator
MHDPGVRSTRDRLLDAAEQIVAQQGLPALTLEAVAAASATSKGGLLYHFGSKDALIAGMIDRFAGECAERIFSCIEDQPPGAGRTTRGIVLWAFDGGAHAGELDRMQRMLACVLSANLGDHHAIEPLKVLYRRVADLVAADGIPTDVALTVLAACDGAMFASSFGMYRLDDPIAREIRGRLLALIDEAVARPNASEKTAPKKLPASTQSGRVGKRDKAAKSATPARAPSKGTRSSNSRRSGGR